MAKENWVTRPEMARIIGCSEASISTYCKSGMPHKGGGKKGNPLAIETATALVWYVDFESSKKNKGMASPKETGVDYDTEAALEKRASRMIKEIDLAERQNLSLAAPLVEQVVIGAFNVMIQNIQPVARKVIPELRDTDNVALATSLFEDALADAMTAAANEIETELLIHVTKYGNGDDTGDE